MIICPHLDRLDADNKLETKNTQAKMIVRITSPPFLKTMKAIISQPNTSINEIEGTFFGKVSADGGGKPLKSVGANHS